MSFGQYPPSGGGGGGAVDSVNGKTGVVVLTKSDIGLGNVNNTSDANKPISTATQSALNAKAPIASPTFTGSVSGGAFLAAEGDTSPVSGYGFTGDGDTGMYSSGDGALEFYNNGFLRLEMDQSGIKTINSVPTRFPSSQGTAGQTWINDGSGVLSWGIPTITNGATRAFAGFNDSNVLDSISGWVFSSYSGLQESITVPFNNDGNKSYNAYGCGVELLQDSPDDSINIHQTNVNIDSTASGFDFGTNTQAVNFYNCYIGHGGTGDLGTVQYFTSGSDIGNGTDPISARGLSGFLMFNSFKNNVTINGPIQGYIWQPSCESGAVFGTSGVYITAFGDNTNFPVDVPGYISYQCGTQIGAITNNNNFNGLNLNPSISEFQGNANFFGINMSPNLGTFDTGSFFGININPQAVSNVVNATGLYINMNNVTATGTKRAIEVVGDVSINGALSFTGGLTIGQLSSISALTLAPSVGPGQPTTNNLLISQLNGTSSVSNADTLGINTAALINIDAGVAITTSFIGVAALGLPAVMNLGAGATIDNVAGALFALSLGGGSGTADNAYLCRALSIPDGTTTINKLYGYAAQLPFGPVGTTNWGFYESGFQQNYMAHALKIGGTPGSNDTPTNASVGLELDNTTQAVLLSRMTTTQRDALTAVAGMILFNTTTNKFQGYDGTTWTDLN